MANSAGLFTRFFKPNATVKGWCLTGFFDRDALAGSPPTSMTGYNFIDGYNLIFDDEKYKTQFLRIPSTTQQGISTGAIPFKFIVPLANTKYKVFVQPKTVGPNYGQATGGDSAPRALFAFCLNSAQYPKTKEGFWIRFGFHTVSVDTNFYNGAGNSIVNGPGVGATLNRVDANLFDQLQVVVL